MCGWPWPEEYTEKMDSTVNRVFTGKELALHMASSPLLTQEVTLGLISLSHTSERYVAAMVEHKHIRRPRPLCCVIMCRLLCERKDYVLYC